MAIKRTLKPGQPGTMRFVERYGDELVCVRYRYDVKNKKRYTTVEIIVENSQLKPRKNKIMNIRIEYGEVYLGRQVKAAGGKWNKAKKIWELPYKAVVQLGLTHRIVETT
jgi:hypothetical protein